MVETTKLSRNFESFMLDNYYPGVRIPSVGDVFACRKCSCLVIDSNNALERHVKWHEEVATFDALPKSIKVSR